MGFDEVSLNIKLKCSAKSVRDADFIGKPWSLSSLIKGVDFYHSFLFDSQSISNQLTSKYSIRGHLHE
jgi:hypothetical protein